MSHGQNVAGQNVVDISSRTECRGQIVADKMLQGQMVAWTNCRVDKSSYGQNVAWTYCCKQKSSQNSKRDAQDTHVRHSSDLISSESIVSRFDSFQRTDMIGTEDHYLRLSWPTFIKFVEIVIFADGIRGISVTETRFQKCRKAFKVSKQR